MRYLHSHGRKRRCWVKRSPLRSLTTLCQPNALGSEAAATLALFLVFLLLFLPLFCLLYTIISTPALMNSVVITSSPQAANTPFVWNTDSCLLPQWTKLGKNMKESQIKIMRETDVSRPSPMYLSICFSVTFRPSRFTL